MKEIIELLEVPEGVVIETPDINANGYRFKREIGVTVCN
ncbi:hypothetical protein SAMN05216352_106189 [Alteribacillus bidgolensis]|uniref:Uncharacterized protein n=1 Tax=Alteribacillus bidgolensis TaxID=930129 RepID=A0A1G8JI21_9BACI|nr:hypothetical protein SAMN05216352_106189 [Alteribacillus bidgolensis]